MDTNDSQDVDVNVDDAGVDTGDQAGTDTGRDNTTTTTEKPSESPEAKHARLLRQTNRLRKDMGLPPLVQALVEKPQPQTKTEEKKGFDYGQLAYLEAKGITDESDQDWLQDIATESKSELKAVLAKDWVQKELKERKDLRMSEAATPAGSKRAGNSTRDQVDYWIAKGELPPVDQPELRRQVVNARIKSETNKSQFTTQS